MLTSVYRMPRQEGRFVAKTSLVCQLRETTPQAAIEMLQKAGVLAIEGPTPSSIVLVGFHREIRDLLQDFRTHGGAHKQHSRSLLGKLHKLSLTA